MVIKEILIPILVVLVLVRVLLLLDFVFFRQSVLVIEPILDGESRCPCADYQAYREDGVFMTKDFLFALAISLTIPLGFLFGYFTLADLFGLSGESSRQCECGVLSDPAADLSDH